MIRITSILVAGLVTVCVAPAGGYAQETLTVALGERTSTPAQSGRPGSSILDTRVDVHLDDVLLADALQALARSANVKITLAGPVIAVKKRVSLNKSQMLLGKAFETILHDTGIRFTETSGGNVVFTLRSAGAVVQGVILGKVIDASTKQPLSGATVTVDGMTQTVTTAADGTFRLSVGPGEHTVHVRSVGRTRQSKKITVTEGASVTVEFALAENASVLDEVIVTGTVVATERRAVSTPVTVITGEEIARRGITRLDQFFRGEVPGVVVADRGILTYGVGIAGTSGLGNLVRSEVYARGVANVGVVNTENPLKTYIDGVEMTDPAYLGTIDVQSIEKIEIVTGPQAATIYGSGAMGGVMQIFMKRGSGQRTPVATFTLRYGLLESNLSKSYTPSHQHNVNITGSNGPGFSYSLSGSYEYTGQWQPDLFARTSGGSVGATYTASPFTVAGSAMLTGTKNGTSNAVGPIAGPVGRDLCEAGEWSGCSYNFWISPRISSTATQLLSLNADYNMTDRWQHHITLGKSINNFSIVPDAPRFTDPGDTLYAYSASNGSRTTFNYNTTYASSPSWPVTITITVGGNSASGNTNTTAGCTPTRVATQWGGCNARDISGMPSAEVATAEDENRGGFGSLRIGVLNHLFLNVGLRGEHTPNYGEKHQIDWAPTVGITYAMDMGDWTLKMLASHGRASRAPGAIQRLEKISVNPQATPARWISTMANPLLRPEISEGPQGGIELYYGNRMSLTINRYKQRVKDLIMSVAVDSFPQVWHIAPGLDLPVTAYTWQYQNGASLIQQGWEATGSVTISRLTLRGTYSWMDSRVEKTLWPPPSPQPGDVFIGIPSHNANVTATYAIGGTSITLSSNYAGATIQQGASDERNASSGRWRIVHYLDRGTTDFDPPNWVRPGYTKTNVNVSQRFSSRVSGLLQINNVGDSYEADTGPFIPTLGRQTLLGVSVRYGSGR